MAGADAWTEVVELLLASPDPAASRHLPRFWAVARADGLRVLGPYMRQLGDARARDLVDDLLATKLEAILDADSPRAYFVVAVRRRAYSWLRGPRARDVPLSSDADHTATAAVQPDPDFVHDARAALARLTARDRDVVIAVALGSAREEVAREHGTSRANIDQIVSRVQRRFREGE